MRFALGIAVFSGMLGVTAFGLFFTPVFYEVIRSAVDRRAAAKQVAPAAEDASSPGARAAG
jgi:multidrug efflux pump